MSASPKQNGLFEAEHRIDSEFQADSSIVLAHGDSQVEFVVLNSYEDMAAFPKPLKDAIGRKKFILAEIYQNIEKLWPTHII
jgi:hypothetical protein